MTLDPEILIIIFLGGFYFILEGVVLLIRFVFERKEFMSWWEGKPVQQDEHTMYCPTYNRLGQVTSLTLNMK